MIVEEDEGTETMTIVLTYTTEDGSQEQVELEDRYTTEGLRSIDLSPLTSRTNLKELRLERNSLQSIDLSPLSSCACLQILDLNDNQLRTINLSPLSSCTNLRELNLANNMIPNIDLSPLSSCTQLESLNLGNNQLRNIDLSPLRYCTNLGEFLINWNYLEEESVIPIHFDKERIEQEKRINTTRVVTTDSDTKKMTIEYEERNIDFSKLSECKNLEELIISSCENIESIDLSSLNNSTTLRIIKIIQNNAFQHLVLPSGCTNLQTVIISDNRVKPKKRHPDYYSRSTGSSYCKSVRIESKMTVQRIEQLSWSEWKARSERKSRHSELRLDLRALNGSPNLRELTLENNELSFILPSNCPKLDQNTTTRDSNNEKQQQREIEKAAKERESRAQTQRLLEISNCSSASTLYSLLRNVSDRDEDDYVKALEKLLLRRFHSVRIEFAHVVLNHPRFNKHFLGKIPWSQLGIKGAKKRGSQDYVQLLRKSLVMQSKSISSKKQSEQFQVLSTRCIEILNHLFQNYENYDGESIIVEIADYLDGLTNELLQSIFYLSLISLQKVHTAIINDWFSHGSMLDVFSRFLSERLLDLYHFSYQMFSSINMDTFFSFFDSVKLDSKIVEGIASFISNQKFSIQNQKSLKELILSHQNIGLYNLLTIVSSTKSLVKENDISNALLKHSNTLVDLIKTEGELFNTSEIWCWDLIRCIEKIPSIFHDEEIQSAILHQTEFIAGYLIFASPRDYPVSRIVETVTDGSSLLTSIDIQTALCFCFRFNDVSNFIDVSRLATNDDLLKYPLLREALREVIDNRSNSEIKIPSKYSRVYSSTEIQDISKTIEETRFPLAAVMNAYFANPSTILIKHSSIKQSAISRLSHIAKELEFGHHGWNYFDHLENVWNFCQIDLLFERGDIISILNQRKSEILEMLNEYVSEKSQDKFEKLLSVLGFAWNEYDGMFHDTSPIAYTDEQEILHLRKQVLNAEYEEESYECCPFTLYDLVKLWTHPNHPWTPEIFNEVIGHSKGPFNKEDPIWNFHAEFPSGTNFDWSPDRTTKISVEELKKRLVDLISEYDYALKSQVLTSEDTKYYIKSLKLISEHEKSTVSGSSEEQ